MFVARVPLTFCIDTWSHALARGGSWNQFNVYRDLLCVLLFLGKTKRWSFRPAFRDLDLHPFMFASSRNKRWLCLASVLRFHVYVISWIIFSMIISCCKSSWYFFFFILQIKKKIHLRVQVTFISEICKKPSFPY